RLGISADATAPAVEAGLVEFGMRVRFRHPLRPCAAYGPAPPQERQQVHGALSEVTDPEQDPDRHAWHRAHATPGPDEAVAAELERSAGRAPAAGGAAAGRGGQRRRRRRARAGGLGPAAFCHRPPAVARAPARRTERALAAASAKI